MPVIACTSGASGGWHVFLFSHKPWPIAEWSAFLRKLSHKIGAKIVTPGDGGDCELHSIETRERPRGIRAPGSLNPKDGSFGLIAFDTLTKRLRKPEWRKLLPAKLKQPAPSAEAVPPKRIIIALGELLVREHCARYPIWAADTRHKRLLQMMGSLVNQCGQGLGFKAAVQLYKQAQPACKTSLDDHMSECQRAWRDCTRKRVAQFNRAERRAYLACKTETEGDVPDHSQLA